MAAVFTLHPLCGVNAVKDGGEPADDVFRIAFGSCAHQGKPQPVWDAIAGDQPDVMLMLGDNIYADTEDPELMAQKYAQMEAIEGFARLRKRCKLIGIWDDHDYGCNDAGREYPMKATSRELMLRFFREEPGSPRWTRPDGIYASYLFGPEGRRVQVILLDTRWNREALCHVSPETYEKQRAPARLGPYLPHADGKAAFLGEAQWAWLEACLQQPAELRLIASSIQVWSDYSAWECWANFPHEQERLLQLLDQHRVEGVFFISGDTHWAEFSRLERKMAYPLWELTSSGLTEEWPNVSPNRNRMGHAFWAANYGLLDIHWDGPQAPHLTASIKDAQGHLRIQNTFLLKDLRHP
jgi:alkaline phosphatase D